MADKNEIEKRNITVFGEETEFDGVLEFSDRLVITGKFSGKINAPTGDLEIAKNAVCKVDKIDANSIIVAGGDVNGDMNAAERVEICSGSKVIGNISTARIRIAKLNPPMGGKIGKVGIEIRRSRSEMDKIALH